MFKSFHHTLFASVYNNIKHIGCQICLISTSAAEVDPPVLMIIVSPLGLQPNYCGEVDEWLEALDDELSMNGLTRFSLLLSFFVLFWLAQALTSLLSSTWLLS